MTREDAYFLFEAIEVYMEEHPGCTEDEAYDVVCMWNIDKEAARIDALKEERRDASIYA